MDIQVSSGVLESIQFLADYAQPRECCGILFGTGNRIDTYLSADNVHPAPETHFEIDPAALIEAYRAEREGGPQVVGYYHSHPTGDAAPSATDRQRAAHDGKVWAIIAGGVVRFFRDGEDRFEPLSYKVAPR